MITATQTCAWHFGSIVRAAGTGFPHFFPVDPVRALLRTSSGEVDWNSHLWSTDPSSSPQSWAELTSMSLVSSPNAASSASYKEMNSRYPTSDVGPQRNYHYDQQG